MEALDKLTIDEKDLLRKSWKVLEKSLNNTAYNIFEMIINQSPDTKALFPFIKMNQGGRSREMEFHALRFMQVLESVVKTLDNPESLNPLCDNLGRVHGRLSESRGFRTHHWAVFIECTLYHFRRVLSQDSAFHRMEPLDKVIILWRTILRLLIKQMKRGFNTDIRNRAASREIEDTQKASTSSSPVSSDNSSLIALPQTITQSITLPNISNNYKSLEAARVTNGDRNQSSTGIFRPLKDFARRKFISHF
ncbi:unnamed protein product [Caenorhabditis bovis]|uniref:Globin domain-containing protein n=1 Tax=Caenorhabditis bovis TaxID=2654633 RepID=A0A8S1F0Y5_9PELO|nr:unnamed protein product [Caenorhabditis bovis]